MGGRQWTTKERDTAIRMRLDDRTHAEIGEVIGRPSRSVSRFLLRIGQSRTGTDRARDAMLRRGLPLRLSGMPLTQVAEVIGWPASWQALQQGLTRYRRRLGRLRG